jgi:hypothetical protein
MKREKEMFKILKRILDKENVEKLKENIIYQDSSGYVMYGEYVISNPTAGEYLIQNIHTFTVKYFNNLRNAVIWVTLDKSNKIMYAKKVEQLDTMLTSADNNIQVQKRLSKNGKNPTLAYAKLTEEALKKNSIIEELEYFAGVSKTLQEQKFNKLLK